MLQLVTKNIEQSTQNRLTDLQNSVNGEATFANKAARAKALWNGKNGSMDGKAAFDNIKAVLETMCVGTEICNYCEQNEANDIEHIAPKSFFPEKAFVWNNYLLACKQCNTGYKLDTCYVLNDDGNIVDVTRGTQPLHPTLAFINPRLENPNDFLLLNMEAYQFELLPDLDNAQTHKANKTLDILKLNERDVLIEARKNAARYYYDRLDRLVRILNAATILEIQQILTPYENLIDDTQPLATLKENIKNGFKNAIQTFQHPSVWHAIKTIESRVKPRWQHLFAQLPEALAW